MQLNAGARLRSPISTCELLVVRGPEAEGDLLCGGVPMTTEAVETTPAEGDGEMLQVGKRYAREEEGLEVLCVKPGKGPLEFNGVGLELKASKPLPASD